MVIRLGKGGPLFAEVARPLDGFVDGPRENDLDGQILLQDPLAKSKAATGRLDIGENDLDIAQGLQRLLGLVAIRRFEYSETAFAEIFAQRMTHDDVPFDEKNDGR